MQNFSYVQAVEAEQQDHKLVRQYKEVVNSYRSAGLSGLNKNEDENGIVNVVLLIHNNEETKSVDSSLTLDNTNRLLQVKNLREAQHRRLVS